MVKRILNLHLPVAAIIALLGFFPTCAMSSPEEITMALQLEPDIENGRKIYPLCASCHMKTGWGKQDGSFPVIAGQHRDVLIKQLADIRDKNRINPTMYPFTDPGSIGGSQGISDVTAYIATLPVPAEIGVGSGKNLETGKKIYAHRCMKCHGKNGEGNDGAFFPRVSSQHYAYLLRQLKWLRNGYRKNGNTVMLTEIKAMTEDELDAVADYLSRIK